MQKVCNKCQKILPISFYAKQKLGKDGYRASCKECVTNTYLRTKKGLIFKMHANQRAKSKKRNHPQPSYTKEDLVDWCMKQPLFHTLYDAWVSSNFDTQLIPTCDRLDDYKPYSLDNICLATFTENSNKYYQNVQEGLNTKSCQPVLCFDLNDNFIQEYHSLSAAARAVGTSHANIRNVCTQTPLRKRNPDGTYRTFIPRKSMGFIWKFKEI